MIGMSRLFQSNRLIYRPEVYLRDKQAQLYIIDQENIEKEKRGEKPQITSPVVLWN